MAANARTKRDISHLKSDQQEADTKIVLHAFDATANGDLPSNETPEEVEKLVCQLFLSKTDICSFRELRWWLFTKEQARSLQLPPTQAALHQAAFRAHYHLLVRNNDIVPNPVLPSPEGFGWKREEDEKAWIPVMTTLSQHLRQSSTS